MIAPRQIIIADSEERWRLALQEAEKFGICGLAHSMTGPDPLRSDPRAYEGRGQDSYDSERVAKMLI